jgi:PAS domain S-box-containing protein
LVGKDITERKRIENKLKKSKHNYKELSNELEIIFNNVPAIIYYKDINNNIIRVNEQYANRLGLKPEDIKNKSAFKLFPREMAKKYWNHDLEVIKSGEPKINFVEPMKTPSEIRWTLNSKIPVKNKKGKVIGIIGFGNDITELKKTEKQLKISERKFRRISEDAKDGIYFVNEDGIVTFWNKAAESIFGYSKTQALGKTLDELIIPKNRKEHFKKNIKAIKETGTSPIMDKTIELNAYTKQGEEIFMEVSHSTIRLKDKWHAIAFVREITERREIERNLREAEELFRKIAERTDMGVIILQNGELVYMNEQFPELFGYTKQQISDWSIDDFPKCIHSDDRHFIIKQSREKQMGKGEVIRNHEFRGIDKSGNIIWLNLYSNTIFYSGNLANLMTIIDITERKKAELELKQSERRYRKAYELANVYKDLLAHDINNILQNIKSAIQLEKMYYRNRDKGQKDKAKDYRETINDQVLRGMKLISNVRKLTKLENIGSNHKSVDVIEVLNESVKYVEKSFPKKNININLNSPHKDLELKANEFLLDVFENILINAVKYNENEEVIIFVNILKEVQDGTQYLKMEFIDNGIGISDENKKRIFKSGAIKGKGGKGMGFGLALVKKIIHSMEGTIIVENKVENDYTQGSNFIIRLPFENK